MTKEQFIDQLLHDVYCRIMPSVAPNGFLRGVGVFAIKDIPAGTNPFVGCDDTEYQPIPLSEFPKDIPSAVFDLMKDMLVLDDEDNFWFSDRGIQGIDISYFLNHSKTPNMVAAPLGENFFASRDIKAGEELTVNYDTYDSQPNEEFRK